MTTKPEPDPLVKEVERRMRGQIGDLPNHDIPRCDGEWMIDRAVSVCVAMLRERDQTELVNDLVADRDQYLERIAELEKRLAECAEAHELGKPGCCK